MRNPPTMQDVANAAGVGKATVSLALRNDPRLRPETRQRIQQIAEQIGYRANATVANLMAQLRASRTPKYQATLGLLNAAHDPTLLRSISTFRAWVAGSQERVAQLGYSLDQFWLFEPGINAQRLIRILESRNIRGLLIAAALDHGILPREFAEVWERFACVAIGIRATVPPLNCASNDQYTTAYQAVGQALARGYQRPGLVLSPEVDAVVDRRFSAGFWGAQQEFPESRRLAQFEFAPDRMLAFQAWVKEWKPDVVFTLHTQVRDWAHSIPKLKKPIGLVHLDRTDDLSGWAGMRQNSDLVGAAAVDILVGQLHRNEIGVPSFAKSALIQSTWVDGETLPVR